MTSRSRLIAALCALTSALSCTAPTSVHLDATGGSGGNSSTGVDSGGAGSPGGTVNAGADAGSGAAASGGNSAIAGSAGDPGEAGEAGSRATTCTGTVPTGTLPPLPQSPLSAAAAPMVIQVDASQLSGALKKAGLGTLFGIASMPATPRDLAIQTQVTVSEHMMTAPYNAGETAGTAAVVPTISGSDIRMVARFNDLMGGNPWYQWGGLSAWLQRVDTATHAIQSYRGLLYAVAPFNEPDNSLHGLENDATIPGATYDAKFNWLWTQTVQKIRSIDAAVPIMGPNFEFYAPWVADQQTRMKNFLTNAIRTGTTPTLIAWHNLGPSPGDVPEALKYYRPLEDELAVPGRPLQVVIEEYGPETDAPASTPGNFEGVPGTMVKYWAELERSSVDYGSMGVYTTPGLLGNTLRHRGGGVLEPNGGWQMMKWYHDLRGEKAFVSRWDTRAYLASDGVAAWDDSAQTLTLIAGGQDGDVDVQIAGLATHQLGPNVRVRLDEAVWTKDPNEVETRIDRGGDPQTATLNVFDKTFTIDDQGTLTVPIRRMALYDGYRLIVSAVAPADTYPNKYEAEDAAVTSAVVHRGSDAGIASGPGFVAGIDSADSAVTFDVNVATAGIYLLTARYANGSGTTATHLVSVNCIGQGLIAYPTTPNGWSATEMGLATTRVLLNQGHNLVRLAKGTGFAELDFIELHLDTHRYEAESAKITSAVPSDFWGGYLPDYVGQIDEAASAVEFVIDAPTDGKYQLDVSYSNGTTSTATHDLFVDDVAQGSVSYAPTKGWFSTPVQDLAGGSASAPLTLHTGLNRVRLQKGTGNAELDAVSLTIRE
jgi:hypothetical protein